jgi:hypothetical protein
LNYLQKESVSGKNDIRLAGSASGSLSVQFPQNNRPIDQQYLGKDGKTLAARHRRGYSQNRFLTEQVAVAF